jgi:DNA-binding winged helix-turn-helix (wHTH) protein
MLGNNLAQLTPYASNASPRADVLRPRSSPNTPGPDGGIIALSVLVMSLGSFQLLPDQRLLLEGDRPLRVGSRALDILVALVERAGNLVSKDELMTRGWPDTFVDDANLRVHVAALRRALRDGEGGNRYIFTVPGRGYWFVAPVARSTGLIAEMSMGAASGSSEGRVGQP